MAALGETLDNGRENQGRRRQIARYWRGMSRKNVEALRRGYEHYIATGDFLEELVHPDFVWDMSTFRGWPERQTYDGTEGARDFMRTGGTRGRTGSSRSSNCATRVSTWWPCCASADVRG